MPPKPSPSRGMKISGAPAKVGAADRLIIVSCLTIYSRALTTQNVFAIVCVSPRFLLVVSFDGRGRAAGRF